MSNNPAYGPDDDLTAYPPPGSRAFVSDPADPTDSVALRQRFLVEVERRFDLLEERVERTIAENDALGIETYTFASNQSPPWRNGRDLPRAGALAGANDVETVQLFDEWMEGELTRILDDPVPNPVPGFTGNTSGWANTYLEASYDHGVGQADRMALETGAAQRAGSDDMARAALASAPATVPDADGGGGGGGRPPGGGAGIPGGSDPAIDARHRQAKAMFLSNGWNEITGTTDQVRQRAARAVSDGLKQGNNPLETARLVEDATGFGRQRTEMIARTESIRGVNESALTEYDRLALPGVTAAVEYRTSGDSKVCDDCAYLEGRQMSIDDARGEIPQHPNCRCFWIPL